MLVCIIVAGVGDRAKWRRIFAFSISDPDWRFRLFFLFIASLIAHNLVSGNGWAGETTLEKLRVEAPPAWKQIREFYDGKEFAKKVRRVDLISTSDFPKPIVLSETRKDAVVARADNHLRIRREVKVKALAEPPEELTQTLELVETAREGTEILNLEYHGSLTEQPMPRVHSFKRLTTEGIKAATTMELDYETLPALRLGNSMLDRSIVGFPNFTPVKDHANYVVVDAEEFTDKQGRALVKVVLDVAVLKDGEFSSTSPYLQESTVVLDPNRHWCLVEYFDRYDNGEGRPSSSLRLIVTPRSGQQEFHPLKVEKNDVWSDGSEFSEVQEFGGLRRTNLTTDDCYFSSYGLSEPTVVPARSRSLTLILVATILVVLTIVVRRRFMSRTAEGA